MKNLYIVLILLCTLGIKAQEISFSQKIGKLMELATNEIVDVKEIEKILTSMQIDGKEVKVAPLNYSIYEGFEGQTLYYIPFKAKEESRFSVEQVTKDNRPYFAFQFLLNSSYTIDKDSKINYTDPNYAYTCNLEELKQFCTKPMKYKNNKTEKIDTPLLSCIYTNPRSGKRLMYWVVCEDPIIKETGNSVIEIKIQSIEFWR